MAAQSKKEESTSFLSSLPECLINFLKDDKIFFTDHTEAGIEYAAPPARFKIFLLLKATFIQPDPLTFLGQRYPTTE